MSGAGKGKKWSERAGWWRWTNNGPVFRVPSWDLQELSAGHLSVCVVLHKSCVSEAMCLAVVKRWLQSVCVSLPVLLSGSWHCHEPLGTEMIWVKGEHFYWGWSDVASLFNPNNSCDLVDTADLQNGEQVNGTVSLISPLFMEKLQEQGFKAPSPGSRLLSGAWDIPLRACRLWFRFQLWIRLWVDLNLSVLRETKENNSSFTLCRALAPVSNAKLLALSQPRASPGDPNGSLQIQWESQHWLHTFLRLFQDIMEYIQNPEWCFLWGPRPQNV